MAVRYHGVTHFDAYVDFITMVLAGAPDQWIRESFLEDEDQLDLDKAFAVLREQFHLIEERVKDADKLAEIRALLEASYTAYKAGEDTQGAFLIQDFEELILKSARRR
jgi:hypothetical protein